MSGRAAAPGPGVLPPVLLVGCGKMGGALLSGWLARGIAGAVAVDPRADAAAVTAAANPAEPADAGRAGPAGAGPGVQVVPDAAALPADFRPAAVLLAIKPQEAPRALPHYRRFAEDGALFVSIMAGHTVSGMAAMLGAPAAIVRAMPNTPAAIGQGFTAAFAAPGVSGAHRDLTDALLSAVGEVDWVAEEGLLDAVTAVSGGGPAYVFLLAELLEAAARDQGLPPDLARRMARATVAGSGALLAQSAEDAAVLRQNVTSPKGTTERALAVLMAEDAWPALVRRAVAAATARSRELAG